MPDVLNVLLGDQPRDKFLSYLMMNIAHQSVSHVLHCPHAKVGQNRLFAYSLHTFVDDFQC